MSAAQHGPRRDDPVEGLLRRIGRWLDMDAPDPAPHPDASAFAAYVDWLAGGAKGECPEPEAQAHVAACRECYRKAEELVLAHLQAEREAHCRVFAAFRVCLAHEPGVSYVTPVGEAGGTERLRVALVPRGGPIPFAGAVAEVGPSADSTTPTEGGPADLLAGSARVTVEARADRGRFDLAVAARRRDTGAALPALTIRLCTPAGEVLREDATDAQGTACFYALDPSEYRVVILA